MAISRQRICFLLLIISLHKHFWERWIGVPFWNSGQMLGREMTLWGMFYGWGRGQSWEPFLFPQPPTWLRMARFLFCRWWFSSLHCCAPENLKAQLRWKLQRETPKCWHKRPVTLWVHHGALGPLGTFHSQAYSLQILCYAGIKSFFLSLFFSVSNSNEGNEFFSIIELMNLKWKKKRRHDLRKIRKLT